MLTNLLLVELQKTGRFSFVDRRNLDKVLEEQEVQMSGMVSASSAVKIGNVLGAKYLITSNIGEISKTSVIYAQITDCESGKILKAVSTRSLEGAGDNFVDAIGVIAAKLQ